MSWIPALAFLLPLARVDVQEPGLPLSLLLPKLSAQLHRPLTVQPSLAQEWILIDAKDVEPDDLLARIAEVTHADWQPSPEGLKLERSAVRERELATAAARYHAANLSKRLNEELDKLPSYRATTVAGDIELAMQTVRREQTRSAIRGLTHAVAQVPDRFFVAPLVATLLNGNQIPLQADRRLVFSSHPVANQRPFPSRSKAVLARYLEEADHFEDLQRGDRGLNAQRETKTITLRIDVGRTLLGAPTLDGFLSRIDASGRRIASGAQTFGSSSPVKDPLPASLTLPPDEVRDEIGALRLEEREFRELSAAAQSAILNPERDGDLTRLWGACVQALARKENRSVVANLSDALVELDEGSPWSQDALIWLRQMEGYEFLRSENWLTARLRHPGPAGRDRLDRNVLGLLLRQVHAEVPIRLEAGAEAHLRLGPYQHVAQRWIEQLDAHGGACTLGFYSGNEFGWRLLQGTSAGQRQALFGGRAIPFSQLSSPFRGWLRNEWLASDLLEQVERESVDPASGQPRSVQAGDFQPSPDDLWSTRVEATFESNTQFEGATLKEGVASSSGIFDPERVASTLGPDLQLLPSTEPIEEMTSELRFTHVRPVRSRSITFRLVFPNGFFLTSDHNDVQFLPPDRYVLPHQLPLNLRELLRRLQKAKPADHEGSGQ